MKYKITLNAWVKDDADLPAIRDALKKLVGKLTNIKNAHGMMEQATLSYHECRHDEGKKCTGHRVLWELN